MKRAREERSRVVVKAPEFGSEAEEAKWWDAHQDLVADLLIKHGRRAIVPTKSVTMRLPVADIEKARQLAALTGTGYQTLLKTLLHGALKREAREAS
jgi:predicted DNA binding CopG/RHH family protein